MNCTKGAATPRLPGAEAEKRHLGARSELDARIHHLVPIGHGPDCPDARDAPSHCRSPRVWHTKVRDERQRVNAGSKEVILSTDQYDHVVADEKRTGFIAGGPRRARNEGEGFWAFLRDWIASLFSVDRRM